MIKPLEISSEQTKQSERVRDIHRDESLLLTFRQLSDLYYYRKRIFLHLSTSVLSTKESIQTAGSYHRTKMKTSLFLSLIITLVFGLDLEETLDLDQVNLDEINKVGDSILTTFNNANQSIFGQFNHSLNNWHDFSDHTNEAANDTLEYLQQWLKEK